MTNITEVSKTFNDNRKQILVLLETDYDGRKLTNEEKENKCNKISRIIINQLKINPEVLKSSSPDSIYLAAMEGVKCKLELGRDFHLVPFGTTCKCMLDYKGKLKLAKRSKRITKIDVQLVYENDEYSWEAEKAIPFHRVSGKNAFNRGKIIGVYAIGKELDARGIEQTYYEPMSVADVDKVRNDYSKQKNGTAWTKSWGEMAKKTVLNRIMKRLDSSIEDQFEIMNPLRWTDDKINFDNKNVIDSVAKEEKEPQQIEEQLNPTDQLNAAFDAKEKEKVPVDTRTQDDKDADAIYTEGE